MTPSFSIRVPYKDAFSFAHILDYLRRSSNECLFRVENQSVLTLLKTINKELVLIAVTDSLDGSLTIEFPASTEAPPASIQHAAIAFVREWFDMDRDLGPFYVLAESDPLLRIPASRFYGLRLVGIEDLFEAMCWGIMGQQINLVFAYTLKRRFTEQFGSSVSWEGRTYWAFPTAECTAALEPSELTSLQFTGRKAEYLIGTARLIADGTLSKEHLLALPDWSAVEKALTSIRGIGPWTANYVLMRCLHMPAAFPVEDVGLHNALKLLMHRDDKPSLSEIRTLSSTWGEWKSYAAFYLWRLLY